MNAMKTSKHVAVRKASVSIDGPATIEGWRADVKGGPAVVLLLIRGAHYSYTNIADESCVTGLGSGIAISRGQTATMTVTATGRGARSRRVSATLFAGPR